MRKISAGTVSISVNVNGVFKPVPELSYKASLPVDRLSINQACCLADEATEYYEVDALWSRIKQHLRSYPLVELYFIKEHFDEARKRIKARHVEYLTSFFNDLGLFGY